jgi:hypothetical protein
VVFLPEQALNTVAKVSNNAIAVANFSLFILHSSLFSISVCKSTKKFVTLQNKREIYADKYRPDSMVRPHLGRVYLFYATALLATASTTTGVL